MALRLGFANTNDSPRNGSMFAPQNGPLEQSFGLAQRPLLKQSFDQVVIDPIFQEAFLIRGGQIKKIAGKRGAVGHVDGIGDAAVFCHGSYYGIMGDCVTDGVRWYATQRNKAIRILEELPDRRWQVNTMAGQQADTLTYFQGLWTVSGNQLRKIGGPTYTLPFLPFSLMAGPTSLWSVEAGGTWNVIWKIDANGNATRFAGLNETEVNAIMAAGSPVPVDGAADFCTIHTSGPYWLGDNEMEIGIGGDEVCARRIKNGRIATLQPDGQWIEVQTRNGGFQIGNNGGAHGTPYPYAVTSGMGQLSKIELMEVPGMGFAGYLDAAQYNVELGQAWAWGWCYNSDLFVNDNGTIKGNAPVQIVIDNNPVATVIANQYRADLPGIYHNKYCGWSFQIPNSYGDGIQHTLAAFHNGQNLGQSPKTFTFTAQGEPSVMRNVRVTLNTVQNYQAPNADQLTKYRLNMAGQQLEGPLSQMEYVFMGVAAGTYTLEVRAVNADASQQVLRASGQVQVTDVQPQPDPTVPLAAGFTVTLE